MDLPDVNVWIALSDKDHVHHVRAHRYWETEAAQSVALCRLTMLGMLRLLVSRAASGGDPLSIDQAWKLCEELRSSAGVRMLSEPPHLERQMKAWSTAPDFRPRLWTDCAIASWAKCSGARMVTFDRDYRSFQGLQLLELAE